MANSKFDVPVHDSLIVTAAETIYQRGGWWKAVVTYHYEGSETDETAVYLWQKDDGWTRKNKYVIRTIDAWETDKQIVDRLFHKETEDDDISDEFPASDYYTVGAGVTVFQTDEWWKAILKITEKGTYETDEVMVYLWQNSDSEWKRRQKYTIKGPDDWAEERDVIKSILDSSDDTSGSAGAANANDQDVDSWDKLEMMKGQALTGLNAEIDDHLSEVID